MAKNKPPLLAFSAIYLTLASFVIASTALASQVTTVSMGTQSIGKMNFLTALGLPSSIGYYLQNFFDYQLLSRYLSSINLAVTLAIVALAAILGFFIVEIIKTTTSVRKLPSRTIGVIPDLIRASDMEFFQKYCRRQEDGTYACSFSKHKQYHHRARFLFKTLAFTGGTKLLLLCSLFLLQAGANQAFAGKNGIDYSIFLDSNTSGGPSKSHNYSLQSSFGETTSTQTGVSANLAEHTGFIDLVNEPLIGLDVPKADLNLGLFTTDKTTYATSEFEAYYTGQGGYDISMKLAPLKNQEGAEIQPLPIQPTPAVPGHEQFGLNLVRNASLKAGENPIGGKGRPEKVFGTPDHFAYSPQNVIAGSSSPSESTHFTVTMIVNISPTTPAGAYRSELMYYIVPRY